MTGGIGLGRSGMWEVKEAMWGEEIPEGWEPFAVTVRNNTYLVWLRRWRDKARDIAWEEPRAVPAEQALAGYRTPLSQR